MPDRGMKSIKVNAALSLTRQLFSMLFPMITVYYASRALGQENYGAVNYVKSIVSYFHLFAGLGIATYAIREGAAKRDDRAVFNQFANEIFTTNVLSTVIALIGLLVFIMFNINGDLGKDIPLILVFSFTIFLPTLGADWINSVYEDYAYTTVRYIILHFVSLALMFAFIHSERDYLMYAVLTVVSSVGGNVFNVFYIRRYAKLKICNPQRCIKHLLPVLILFSSTIASTIYINSDTTIIGALIDNKAVAIYTVASHIYIVVKHISNSAIMVTVPRLAYYAGNDKTDQFNSLVDKISDLALAILIPSIIGLIVISEPVMVFMGGKDYAIGSSALMILSFSLFFAVFAYILSRCILIPNKEDKTYLVATVISAATNIGLNFIIVPLLSYTGAAITTLISEIIVCSIFYFKSRAYCSLKISKKHLISCILASIPIVLICKIFTLFINENHLYVALSIIMSAIAYFALLFIFKHPLAEEIKKEINKITNKIGKRR